MKTVITRFALAIAAIGMAATASASVLGTFDGTLANIQGADPGGLVNASGNTATWGQVPNELEIKSNSFTGVGTGPLRFGTIDWLNRSTMQSGVIWTVDMSLNIDFSTPDLAPLSESLTLTVDNTVDGVMDLDANEASGNFADIITGLSFAGGAFTTPIDLGNGFRLTDVFFQLDACNHVSVAGACTFDSAGGSWEIVEGASSTLGVYGTIAPVPLPAAGWLLIAGLGALVALRRRQTA